MAFNLFITFFLVFLNGFFVAAEFAIVKVRASSLDSKAQRGNRSAIMARHIVSHLDGYLAATQLGITLASLGLGWLGEPVVSKMLISLMHGVGFEISNELAHNIALPVAFAIITILHIVFGELAPKSIAILRSKRTTLFLAYPLQFFFIIFKPFIWVLNGIANKLLKLIGITAVHGSEIHSSEELKYIMTQGKESGAIEAINYDIINNAFSFSERTVKQIMIPRTQMVAIDVADFNEDTIEKIIEEGYSRVPCYEDNLDNMIGVIYMKDVLLKIRKKEDIEIRKVMRPAFVIPESKNIGQLLKELQSKHQQIAIVANEFGGTEGIVTMEDILEELVGEIQDEYDNEALIVETMDNNMFNVIASASIDNINEKLPHPIEKHAQYETLGGLLIFHFNRIPNTNEKISFDNYEFTIIKKSKNSIQLVQLRDLKTKRKTN